MGIFPPRVIFRGFFRTSDDLYVEILGARDVNDDPEATDRVEAILLGENRQFRIISLEDLIIDRIRACVLGTCGKRYLGAGDDENRHGNG